MSSPVVPCLRLSRCSADELILQDQLRVIEQADRSASICRRRRSRRSGSAEDPLAGRRGSPYSR